MAGICITNCPVTNKRVAFEVVTDGPDDVLETQCASLAPRVVSALSLVACTKQLCRRHMRHVVTTISDSIIETDFVWVFLA